MKKRQQKKNLKKLIKAFREIGNIAGEVEQGLVRMAEEIGRVAEVIKKWEPAKPE